MNGQFIRKIPAFGHLDGVYLPDQIGDGHVGSGQLFPVSLLASQPVDRNAIPHRLDFFQACFTNGVKRIVVNLTSGQHRDFLVQEMD